MDAPTAPPRKRSALRALRVVMPLVGLACFLAFAPLPGIWAWVLPLPDTIQEQLDDAVDLGLDGVVVYVDRAGQPPALYAAGWKDRQARVPADPEALFKIGSVTKLYVVAAAAKLVHAGRLDLDDTLAERLPQLADRIEHAERITVGMLLRHRSGIPDYVDQDGFDWGAPPPDLDGCLALVEGRPADFAPDEDHGYSNTNYALVGRILDDVLGHGHQRYVREELTAPLGLSDTHGQLADVDLERVTSGYHRGYDEDFSRVDFTSAAGSMVATARDVGVFLRALQQGSLLDEGEQAVYDSLAAYRHDGWVLGYHTVARYHPGPDAVVVQLVNTTGGDLELLTKVVHGRLVRILEAEESTTTTP